MYRFVFLFITFIVLKKDLSPTAIIESIIFATITFLINKKCIHTLSPNSGNKISIPNVTKFIVTIIKDIVTSSWNISKLILFKQNLCTISPVVQKINTPSLNKTKTAIFANSITITPGTMTFSIEKNSLYVHALKESYIIEIQDSKLLKHIKNI